MIFDFKNDYLSLLPILKKVHGSNLSDYLWVFLLGEDRFQFNPLRIPAEKGKFLIDPLAFVETWIDIFIHCYGLREPSASILLTCMLELYRESETFNRRTDNFPNLSELKEKVSDYEPLSNFDRESKRSIYTRLRLLTEGVLGQVFDTRVGVKFEDILQRFVILGLGGLPLLENKKFIIELFLGLIYEYAKKRNDRGKTKHLTILEESHNVLPRQKSTLTADILTKPEIFLMEMRDFGYGTIHRYNHNRSKTRRSFS